MNDGVEGSRPASGKSDPSPSGRQPDASPNGAVDKALSVLEALVASSPSAPLATIAAESGASKSNVHAILRTLVRRGYARTSNSGVYEPGPQILALAGRVLSTLDYSSHARPALLTLQVRFPGLTVHFGAFSGADLVYVDKLEARRAYRMASTIGMRLPFHCTAIGKAVLAELSPDVRSNLLSDVGLPRRTSRTIIETGLLDAELARIKHKGFALDNEENEDGVRCVAAPVFGALAGVIGGISVSAPAFELPEVQLEWVASFVIEAAAEVSLSLGALDAVVAAQRQRASALRGVPPNDPQS